MPKLTLAQVLRYPGGNTTDNLNNLCSLIARPNWTVRLYAGPLTGTDADEKHSGPPTNFPLLAALATEDILPGVVHFGLVMDGLLLTARREPRAAEISAVLNAGCAQPAGKVLVAYGPSARAPFTAGMDPYAAADVLAAIPTQPLTASNRSAFWAMLSNAPEPPRAAP